jgi:hypothetical protein
MILWIFCFISCLSQNVKNGVYIGYEEMIIIDAKSGKLINYGESIDSSKKWYHENIMVIHNDSVFLSKDPISIKGKHTFYSASDGSFYYYNGIIRKENDSLFLFLKLDHCDYCVRDLKKVGDSFIEDSSDYKEKKYKLEINRNKIIFDSTVYIRQKKSTKKSIY